MVHKGSSLFKTDDFVRKSGYEERYNKLLEENKRLFTLDLIKENVLQGLVMQIAKKRDLQLKDFKRNHPGRHIGQILSGDRER